MSTDQSRPVSRVSVVEALTQIRALCDEREHGPGPGWIPVDEVRVVLDAVSVDATPAQGIEIDALLKLLYDEGVDFNHNIAGLATRILALVRPVEGIVLSREEAALRAQEARSAAVEDGTY